MRTAIDAFDMRLLAALQSDALATADTLAQTLPLSASAIARRIRRLRDSGVIAGDVALVAADALPMLSAIVHVQLDRHALDAVQALRRRLVASEHVQLLFDLSGPFDLLLVVVARSMDDYNAFTDALLAADPVVRRYETSFVKRRHKFTPALPIAALAE